MKKIILFAGIASLLILGAHAEPLFRWVDSEGNVHYGDRPEPDAVKVEPKKFSAPEILDEDLLPYETRQAKQNFPVKLYVAEYCGEPCVLARDFLNKRGIPFVEKLLVSNEDVEDFRRASGGNSIPTLTVGRTFLQGFEAGRWGGELDAAGYPKAAPYGVRPVAPSNKPVSPESAVPALPSK